MTAHNVRLVRAREELGLSLTKAAITMGLSVGFLCSLETVREPAWNPETRSWRPGALQVAEFYGHDPEYLWAKEGRLDRLRALRLEANAMDDRAVPDTYELLEAKEWLALIDSAARRGLTPIEQKTIARRIFNDETLKEAGAHYGLSRERIRQIELQAYSKIRQLLPTPKSFERVEHTRAASVDEAIAREHARAASAADARRAIAEENAIAQRYLPIEEWSTYWTGNGQIGVQGVVKGKIILSAPLVRVHRHYVETSDGGQYVLRSPHPEFVRWLHGQGIRLNPQMPIDPEVCRG